MRYSYESMVAAPAAKFKGAARGCRYLSFTRRWIAHTTAVNCQICGQFDRRWALAEETVQVSNHCRLGLNKLPDKNVCQFAQNLPKNMALDGTANIQKGNFPVGKLQI